MFLELKHITKTFGQTVANDHISFGLNKGKSWRLSVRTAPENNDHAKILYGLNQADSGEIFLDGKGEHSPYRMPSPTGSVWSSSISSCLRTTVAENIVYGKEPAKNGFVTEGRPKEVLRGAERSMAWPLTRICGWRIAPWAAPGRIGDLKGTVPGRGHQYYF